MGVICAAGHAMGVLTNNGALPWHIAPEEIKKLGRLCGDYCKSHGIELGKLAIWYTAQLDGPATFLVGMATKDIVDINLDSFLNGLTPKEREILDYCLKKYVKNQSYALAVLIFYLHYQCFYVFLQLLHQKRSLGRC